MQPASIRSLIWQNCSQSLRTTRILAIIATPLQCATGFSLCGHPCAYGEPDYRRSAEIGCFLSHRQAWAKLIESDADAALVLEDDMSIGAPFSDALRLACRNVERFGYVQFQTRPQSGDVVDTEGSASLFQPSVTPLRASGQLVSRDCAARLLELTEIFDRPVDTFLQMHWHTGTRVTAIWPSGLEDMTGASGGSTIKKKRPIAEKLLREFQRARYRQLVAKQSKRSVST